LQEILQQGKSVRGICHITFDDGDQTFYDIAYPILQKYQVPVSHFVSPHIIRTRENFWFQECADYDPVIMNRLVTDYLNIESEVLENIHYRNIFKCLTIDQIHELLALYRKETGTPVKPPQNMGPEEIQEMENSGLVTLGAHTLRHPILKNEADASSQKEISESVNGLAEILGRPVTLFAYPNGYPEMDFSDREIGYLQSIGVEMAFSTEPRHFHVTENPYRLPRMGLSPNNPANAFKLLLGARWENIRSLVTKSPLAQREKVYQLIH
jgi:peptidoglycan/xylan/chitin deacetylase (PgdA/CDA1 family)